ncbi:EndoU domain-containing protein [Anaplasma capra]|uniref:EndoU domain-containing protein n=1 Tax=Anaplasma capra TaxID=1562740 RepID=UPI0021D5ED8D|nr:EndoU domain-containing protein [Anaplasma capra]MCU7611350.1 EndoU domain-containing protein [Anaplasma capra]MCU7612424.1 EndoU domain-containing protein [Anaplasma capra]
MKASKIAVVLSVVFVPMCAHPSAVFGNSVGKRVSQRGVPTKIEKVSDTGKIVLQSEDCRYSNTGFNPFFAREADNKCMLSQAPQMHEFDEAVLSVCGAWGYEPSRGDFLSMLNEPLVEQKVRRIYDELNHEVFTADADFSLFKDELAELWTNEGGVADVFCGVPSKKGLKGMHFYGRYLEAQDKKWAGRNYEGLENADDWDFSPSIKFVAPDSVVLVSNKKEMEVDFSHADDIIIRATRAYKGLQSHIPHREIRRCVYDGGDEEHAYVLVAKQNAIVTFYPTMAPNPVCASGINTAKCDCMNYLE